MDKLNITIVPKDPGIDICRLNAKKANKSDQGIDKTNTNKTNKLNLGKSKTNAENANKPQA